MIFGEKDKKIQQPVEPAKPRLEPYEIRVMPPKFHQVLGVKKSGLGKWLAIGLLGTLIVAGIAVGAYFLIVQLRNQQPEPAANLNRPLSDTPPQLNGNAIINENINENVNISLNENINEGTDIAVDENLNTNEGVNLNANTNTSGQATGAITYFSSQDSDNDGLTDVEEDLYGTEKRKPDTDEDGFVDGQEIINLYNPKAAGNSPLETSGLVNKYTNPIFNYEILYIKDWLARPTDQSLSEVIFQSATGEYMQMLIGENPQQLDLVQWYLAQSPLSSISDLQKKNHRQGYEVLVSPDRLTYYIQDPNNKSRIYILSYNIGNKTSVNFLTTFEMMLNSFKLVPAASPSPSLEAESTGEEG